MAEKPLPELSICVDEYLEGFDYDEKDAPAWVNPRSTSREELALARYKVWQPGQRLRIRFLDGDKALRKRVEQAARQWLEFANLEFEFGNFADAEIRITFFGSGFRSLVGTDALQRPDPLPTMTLGGFNDMTDRVELERVTLHEFGHAIGCVHEQASPSVNIPWNLARLYPYYEARFGWDKARVDLNVLKRYSAEEVEFTEAHDPTSIMQYPVPRELTTGDFEIGWNSSLSDSDKLFIAAMYP